MTRNAIIIDESDNVATTLRDLAKGEEVRIGLGEEIRVIVAEDDIPFGHKVAVRAITAAEEIIKYGAVIGAASRPIGAGQHVHVHNVESLRGRGDLDAR
jgi:altronate dehydratase small subunit